MMETYIEYFLKNERDFYYLVSFFWIAIGIIVHFVLVFFPSVSKFGTDWGRHREANTFLSNHISWFIMESPSLFLTIYYYFTSPNPPNWITTVFFSLWVLHYIHRVLYFPLQLKKAHNMPFITVVEAFSFNLVNTYVNARYFFHICDPQVEYPANSYYLQPNFAIGIIVFFVGMYINITSDYTLIRLKKEKTEGSPYRIPKGGMFEYVSAANYFGEIVEWFGFYIATLSWGSLSFLVWTWAGLVARALTHHQWAKNTFKDYPKNRKAVIPFLL